MASHLTMFEHSASDKMQLLGAGELPTPNSCVVCGSGDTTRKFVFLGVHVEFYGAILLCDLCLVQTAEKIGCLAPVIAERIHNESVELAEQNSTLRRIAEELRERLSLFDRIVADIDFDSARVNSVADSGNHSDESGEQHSSETPVQQPGGTESESDESVTSDEFAGVGETPSSDSKKPRRTANIPL